MMKKAAAAEYAAILMAYSEGKTIECKVKLNRGGWRKMRVDEEFNFEKYEYRILQEAQDPQDHELALKQEYQRGYENGKQEVLNKVGYLIADIEARQEHERRIAHFNAVYKSVMGGK